MELTAVTAKLNWLIGCNVGGHRSRISSTNSGRAERAAQSFDNSATCSAVGISPVTNSQKSPSGNGSEPPGALGRSSWHSGMVLPRNLIPSSREGNQYVPTLEHRKQGIPASSTEPSHIKAGSPRIPLGFCASITTEIRVENEVTRRVGQR